MRFLVTLTALLCSACFTTGADDGVCSTDDHCGSGFACTRTQECVATSELSSTRIRWTVNQLAPTPDIPAPCDGIAMLEIVFDDSFNQVSTIFAPVPCELGRTFYDKMPPRFDRVILVAKDNAGRQLDSQRASIRLGENVVDLDLRP